MLLYLISVIFIWVIVVIYIIFYCKNIKNIIIGLLVGILISIGIIFIGKLITRNRDKYNKKSLLGVNTNSSDKLNIYGKKLEKCSPNEESGASQMDDKTCSELDGGVHQICVENIGWGNNFSENTGQSNWSKKRGSNNHCVCIGAWGNYSAKFSEKNDKRLKCDAIPATALDPKYSKKWKTWNQVTRKNQDKYGINELYRQCISQTDDELSKQYLTNLYNNIVFD